MTKLSQEEYEAALAVLDVLISENNGRAVRMIKDVRLMVKAMKENQ